MWLLVSKLNVSVFDGLISLYFGQHILNSISVRILRGRMIMEVSLCNLQFVHLDKLQR